MTSSNAVQRACCLLVQQGLYCQSRWDEAVAYLGVAATQAATPEDADDLRALADYYARGCQGRPAFASAMSQGRPRSAHRVMDPITGECFT
jgi:hypothetical protein